MKEHKSEVAANRSNDLVIHRWLRRIEWKSILAPSRTISIPAGSTPLAMMRVRISSPSTITREERAESPAVQSFPNAREKSGLDNRSAHGHIRIHISNVVHIWLAFQPRHDGSHDSLERWVGHRQHDITTQEKRPRDGQRNVAQIVQHPPLHLETRIVRGTHAQNSGAPGHLRLPESPRPPFARVVRRPATKHRNVVPHRECSHHRRCHFFAVADVSGG